MLTDLNIKNFAIIDDLHISFGPGLCILSGETGAGKSIILGALNLVLGTRASADLIRTGETEATVEALFDISAHPSFHDLFRERGVLFDNGDVLLVKRIVSREGKNKVFINGSLSVLTVLTDIAEALLTIAGQHEHQELTLPQNHIDMLDTFGGLIEERAHYRNRFLTMQSLQEELDSLKTTARQKKEREELLAFQWQEIEDNRLTPGEDEALKKERKILQNARELISSTHRIYEHLYGSDSALLSQISRIQKEFVALERIDPDLVEQGGLLDSAAVQLEDVAFFLRDYGQRLQYDPERLEEVETRLDAIHRLNKKYGDTIDDILSAQQAMEAERQQLSQSSDRIAQLEEEIAVAREETRSYAEALSQKRRTVAQTFCEDMEQELSSLGMKETVFKTRFNDPHEHPFDEYGIDRMEFLFSPNPGEESRPLARIASGGELSRVMLAFKHLFARQEGVATLIFDEVDAGIGGATAEVIGRKLYEISRFHQTVCITHLPQIAVYGDTHYAISKRTAQGRTRTEVTELDQDKRIDELSRMLGGEKITQKTRTLAQEMIRRARGKKE